MMVVEGITAETVVVVVVQAVLDKMHPVNMVATAAVVILGRLTVLRMQVVVVQVVVLDMAIPMVHPVVVVEVGRVQAQIWVLQETDHPILAAVVVVVGEIQIMDTSEVAVVQESLLLLLIVVAALKIP